MVDSIDEEAENRMLSYLKMSRIKSEHDFWIEYWSKFQNNGSVKVGKFLRDKIKEKNPELPKRTPNIIYYRDDIKYRREIIKTKRGRHLIKYRDVKTGRFVK